jgi:AraC-like DNA-binding protein
MEIIFNLGTGNWQTAVGDEYVTTPSIELWGQLSQPLPIRSIGKNTMLGVRFLPHAAAFFLDEKIEQFNNRIADYGDLSGRMVKNLHQRLLETMGAEERISLVEEFLLYKLAISEKRVKKIEVIHDIMHQIKRDDFLENINSLASRYGISSRYLQKLFVQYTGLTPKLYTKIHRFQNSLQLVGRKDTTLTSIAHDCGYFDQSHFIREFKSFTGITPSVYSPQNSPLNFALANS